MDFSTKLNFSWNRCIWFSQFIKYNIGSFFLSAKITSGYKYILSQNIRIIGSKVPTRSQNTCIFINEGKVLKKETIDTRTFRSLFSILEDNFYELKKIIPTILSCE